MIAKHQPTIFGDRLVVAISSVDDGNMRFGRGDDERTLNNRKSWFQTLQLDITQATLVQVTYDTDDFARYKLAADDNKDTGMLEPVSDCIADALVANTPGHALFLPLADCAGVVLYEPNSHTLMVSHLGRHSVEINGAQKSVEYMVQQSGGDPKNIKAWISPAVGRRTYPLHKYDNRGLQEVILSQLIQAGVKRSRIEVSDIDTATSQDYFSHSQFKAGSRTFDGRHAIVASLK